MGTKPRTPRKLQIGEAKTRLLLALWDLGGTGVKKGELMQRVLRAGEKVRDYQVVLVELEAQQGVSLSATKISLASKGTELLSDGLKNPTFEFESQVGSKTANALLKWIRQIDTATVGASSSIGESVRDKESSSLASVKSYEEFKESLLAVYENLNQNYNFDNLVPIYRLRREMGDRVTRPDFNNWLLKMQSNDILQLSGGSVEDSAQDKIQDSVMTEISGLRCYAKRLN